MCKNLRYQLRAIEEAKRTTPHIVKVYDVHDPVDNLIGIIEVINETELEIKSVNEFGELKHHDHVRHGYENDRLYDPWYVVRLLDLDPFMAKLIAMD